MPYSGVFAQVATGVHVRNISQNDPGFATVLAAVLKGHPSILPEKIPQLTNALKGNLGEFILWELGERHFNIFSKGMTYTANVGGIWKNSSDPGIDIMAFDLGQPSLLILEVKTSESHGAGLVYGAGSTLQTDFEKMFEGKVTSRLQVNLSKLMWQIRYLQGNPDGAVAIKNLVGDAPGTCSGISIYATLVCSRGDDECERRRAQAFSNLNTALVRQGWPPAACNYLTVEVDSVDGFLTDVIQQVMS